MPRNARAVPLAFGAYHPDRLRHSQSKLERGMCALVTSLLPRATRPLLLADTGFGRTEFIRRLRKHRFAFVVRLRADTVVHYRGRTVPLAHFDTIKGAPIILSNVQYRQKKPVTVHIVISRLGDSVWYLGTSFSNAKQAVAWYKKRFWIEEMFRDLKSTLGLRKAHLKDEDRLTRLLLAYLILSLIGFEVPRRWRNYFSSRPSLSIIWLALQALDLCLQPRHRKVWRRHIWPALWLQSG
jgi:hypothetical protein